MRRGGLSGSDFPSQDCFRNPGEKSLGPLLMSHHGGRAGVTSEIITVKRGGNGRGEQKKREWGAGCALDPKRQERRVRGQQGEPPGEVGRRFDCGDCWERSKSREGGREAEKEMKMLFHLLPGERGQAEIGRMTESLIGAVGLKEFVFGTSFLSAILKDLDSSEAAPSSSVSISLCLGLLSLFPVSFCCLRTHFWPHVYLCLFFQFLGFPLHLSLS